MTPVEATRTWDSSRPSRRARSLAVRRADGQMLVNPHSDDVLNAGDTLIALGARSDLDEL